MSVAMSGYAPIYARVEFSTQSKFSLAYVLLKMGRRAQEREGILESPSILRLIWEDVLNREADSYLQEDLCRDTGFSYREADDMEESYDEVCRRLKCMTAACGEVELDPTLVMERMIDEAISVGSDEMCDIMREVHRETGEKAVLVFSPFSSRFVMDMEGFVPEYAGIESSLFLLFLSRIGEGFFDEDSLHLTSFEKSILPQ